MKKMLDEDTLQYAKDNNIIDLTYVLEQVEMKKRQEYLDMHHNSIWQGKNGKWYTYLPDENGESKLVKRTTEKAIQNVVVEYWREETENPTVKELFKEWIQNKFRLDYIQPTTVERYERTFTKCLAEFGNERIKQIEEYDIEVILKESVRKHSLTSKEFSNLKSIIRGIFRLAKNKKLTRMSISYVIEDIEVSKRSFRRTKKDDDELVFTKDETDKLFEYFHNNNLNITDLGLLLDFVTGLRPGELAGLERTDISREGINVHTTEIRYRDEKGRYVYEVRDFPKTDAGFRFAIIPEEYAWVVDEILKLNPDGKYLFEKNGKRLNECSFDRRLRTLCDKLGIRRKSPNKIRKTYTSMMIDAKVPDAVLTAQLGHTDIRTTQMYYYKNRNSKQQMADEINNAFPCLYTKKARSA